MHSCSYTLHGWKLHGSDAHIFISVRRRDIKSRSWFLASVFTAFTIQCSCHHRSRRCCRRRRRPMHFWLLCTARELALCTFSCILFVTICWAKCILVLIIPHNLYCCFAARAVVRFSYHSRERTLQHKQYTQCYYFCYLAKCAGSLSHSFSVHVLVFLHRTISHSGPVDKDLFGRYSSWESAGEYKVLLPCMRISLYSVPIVNNSGWTLNTTCI